MPDIGLVELVVIVLVLFLVVGPDRMPELMSQVSGFIRKARGWMNEAKGAIRAQSMELKDPLLQVKKVVRDEMKELREAGDMPKAGSLPEEACTDIRNKPDEAQQADDSNKDVLHGRSRPQNDGTLADKDAKA